MPSLRAASSRARTFNDLKSPASTQPNSGSSYPDRLALPPPELIRRMFVKLGIARAELRWRHRNDCGRTGAGNPKASAALLQGPMLRCELTPRLADIGSPSRAEHATA